MKYVKHIVLAGLIFAVWTSILSQFGFEAFLHWYWLGVILTLSWLVAAAYRLYRSNVQGVSLGDAATVIQAFGITVLVIELAVGGNLMLHSYETDFGAIPPRSLAIIIGQGLFLMVINLWTASIMSYISGAIEGNPSIGSPGVVTAGGDPLSAYVPGLQASMSELVENTQAAAQHMKAMGEAPEAFVTLLRQAGRIISELNTFFPNNTPTQGD